MTNTIHVKNRLPLSSFVPHLDLTRVKEQIENDPDVGRWLTTADLELVRVCLWAAMEKWLVRDIYEFKNTRAEGKFTYELPDGSASIRGIIDLRGDIVGVGAPFSDFSGQRFVLDWKTKETTLTQDWREKLIDSWQWPLYTAYCDASLAIYRGVSWAGNGATTSDYLKEVLIKVPETNLQEVIEHYGSITACREHLINIGATVWPRNKPFACGAYGRECPYRSDCYEYSMPRGTPNPKILSYSSASNFMLCPERSRRSTLDEENSVEDKSWSTEMGLAFHRGIEELYRQVEERNLRDLI